MFKIKKHKKVLAKATRKAENALGMFQRAHDELESANVHLANVVEEANRQAAELQAIAQQATRDMGVNAVSQKKLKDFLEV